MNVQWDGAALLGRIALALTFVMSGFGKITGFSGTVGYIASKDVPLPEVAAALAVLIELGGGLAIIAGWMTRWAALALIVFLVVITPIFHDFWNLAAAEAGMQEIMFMKNVSILGGFLLLFAFGPGRYSIDRR
jgi:putative oxidoreductase